MDAPVKITKRRLQRVLRFRRRIPGDKPTEVIVLADEPRFRGVDNFIAFTVWKEAEVEHLEAEGYELASLEDIEIKKPSG